MYLTAPCLSCSLRILSCSTWNLLIVPCPGVKPGPPTLGVQRFSHWTIREVPRARFLESTSHNFVPSTWTLPSFWTPLLTCVSLTALLSIYTENLPLNLSVPPMKPLSSAATGLSPYHRAPHGLKTSFSHLSQCFDLNSLFQSHPLHLKHLKLPHWIYYPPPNTFCNFTPLQISLPPTGISSLSSFPTGKLLFILQSPVPAPPPLGFPRLFLAKLISSPGFL